MEQTVYKNSDILPMLDGLLTRSSSAAVADQAEIAEQACMVVKQGFGSKLSLSKNDFFEAKEKIDAVFSSIDDALIIVAAAKVDLSPLLSWYVISSGRDRKQKIVARYSPKKSSVHFYAGDTLLAKLGECTCTVTTTRYVDGFLVINAQAAPLPIADLEKITWYCKVNGELYPLKDTGEYASYKLFGNEFLRGAHLRLGIDLGKKPPKGKIGFLIGYRDKELDAVVALKHFYKTRSHLSLVKQQYWASGDKIFRAKRKGISYHPLSARKHLKAEIRFLRSLISSGKRQHVLAAGVRILYWVTRPFYATRRIWLFYDKPYMAGDSGDYMYRYVRKNGKGITPVFSIFKSAEIVLSMRRKGYNLTFTNTLRHRLLYLNADVVWATHSNPDANQGFVEGRSKYFRDLIDSRILFIPHFVAMQNVSSILVQGKVGVERIYCSSKYEVENLLAPAYGYTRDQLVLAGLPRFDGLENEPKKQILVMPTWRPELATPARDDGTSRTAYDGFAESDFCKIYSSILSDARLLAAAEEHGYEIVLLLHPCIMSNVDSFYLPAQVKIFTPTVEHSFESMLRQSKLLVTDYSSVQYDFAYMDKTVLYLHMDEFPPQYADAAMNYETMGFGEVASTPDELVGLLCTYLAKDCASTEETLRRIHDVFAYSDHNCRCRIFEDAVEYLKKQPTRDILVGAGSIID